MADVAEVEKVKGETGEADILGVSLGKYIIISIWPFCFFISLKMFLYSTNPFFFLNFLSLFCFYFFNRSIVDLQYHVSFRYTTWWFSHIYIYSFSGSFPLQFIKKYWVEFPVLYSRSWLVIYFIYSSVYMLIPNS